MWLAHTRIRKHPYWTRCCTFCTQLSWPWSLTVMASACTSMPMTRRFTSAHRLVTLRLPSDVLLRVSSTSRHGWRRADFDWTPPRPRWCGWDLHSSWRKSMFRRFRWRQHVLTSRRRRVTSASSSTACWRCLRRCPPCVAVAIASYGSCDRSSDWCHLTPLRHWSRCLFRIAWTTVTHFSTASRTVWWAGCSLYRMQLRGWFPALDAVTT